MAYETKKQQWDRFIAELLRRLREAPPGMRAYRMNGRRETVTFGKYGPAGLSLARARELCIDAKRAISEGRSPDRKLGPPCVPSATALFVVLIWARVPTPQPVA
ncbi:MAG: hypothetical protein QOI12_3701 [Alphaproteobacteria bacterium]|nr:hypothetical protein [Alphaproteobacteria bacterium]